MIQLHLNGRFWRILCDRDTRKTSKKDYGAKDGTHTVLNTEDVGVLRFARSSEGKK